MQKILGHYIGAQWFELHRSPKGYMYQDCAGIRAHFLTLENALQFFHTRATI